MAWTIFLIPCLLSSRWVICDIPVDYAMRTLLFIGHNNYIGYMDSPQFPQWDTRTRQMARHGHFSSESLLSWGCCWCCCSCWWWLRMDVGLYLSIHPCLINWNRIRSHTVPHIAMGNNRDKLRGDILTLLVQSTQPPYHPLRRCKSIHLKLRVVLRTTVQVRLRVCRAVNSPQHNKFSKCNIEFGTIR